MASLQSVAELNNTGASMLVAGRDKDAFRTLQSALTMMEQEMMMAPDKSDSTASTAASSASGSTRRSTSSSGASSTFEDADAAATTASEAAAASSTNGGGGSTSPPARFCIDTKCSTAIPELRDDRYFIFNQALLVETRDATAESAPPSGETLQTDDTSSSSSPYSQSLVCFYTSVVIYNLALAYHKRGMAAQSNPHAGTGNTGMSNADYSRLALSQSQRLYEHCLKIIRSIANYSEDCKMLLYAVSCNLAHLYCRKGDRCRAQELLDGLEEANRLSYQNILN